MPRKAATPARDNVAAGEQPRARAFVGNDASKDINVLVNKIKTMGCSTHEQKINFIIAISNVWSAERRTPENFRLGMEALFGDNWKALVQEARDVGHARRKAADAARAAQIRLERAGVA